MDAIAFEHHLTSPQGHRRRPTGAFTATAGGFACCDEIELSISVEGDRVTDAGFDARGCGASTAAGSAAVTLARGQHGPRRGADRAQADRRRARRSQPGQAARGRAGRRRARAGARRRRARTRLRDQRIRAGATRHAGRHERRRRQRGRGARCARARARPRRSRSSCGRTPRTTPSEAAARPPRWRRRERWPTRWACPTSRSTCATSSGPAWSSRSSPASRPGETPNPCVGCNGHVRLDAMLELAERLGCATARHRPLRADRRARPPRRAAAARRRRPRQGSDLHAGGARAELAGADALPARRADQAGGQADRRRRRACRSRARSTRRTCASWPAPTAPASSPATAASATHPDRSSTPDGTVVGRHLGQHRFTVGQRRGLGSPRPASRSTCSTRTPLPAEVSVGPRAALETTSVPVRGARLHATATRVDRVKLRYRSRPLPCRIAGDPQPGRHARWPLELARAGRRRGPRAARLPDGR